MADLRGIRKTLGFVMIAIGLLTPVAAGQSSRTNRTLVHEASRPPGSSGARTSAPKAPPSPIPEQPTADRPGPRAQWVPGYWAWDSQRGEFVWFTGSWQVPPRNATWIEGRWERDGSGWTRIPGSWSQPGDVAGLSPAPLEASEPEWRKTGPPANPPDDTPGPAPGPDTFYVPGHYAPEGDRVVWQPGFWAREQPGWEWIPARWVRRPDGWEFRAGSWVPAPTNANRRAAIPDTGSPFANPSRPEDLPPALEDPQPPDATAQPAPAPEVAPGAPPVGPETRLGPPIVVGPRVRSRPLPPPVAGYGYVPGPGGVPYVVIRPPGSYPYGPTGVMVPAAVPPFVQRLLNQVLP
jgi:hypothetical protein